MVNVADRRSEAWLQVLPKAFPKLSRILPAVSAKLWECFGRSLGDENFWEEGWGKGSGSSVLTINPKTYTYTYGTYKHLTKR